MSSQADDFFIASPRDSQDHTQSTQSQPTQDSTFSDYSACLSGTALDRAWGQLDVYRVGEKRFGVRTPIDYSYTKVQTYELTKEKISVGRNKGDIRVSELNVLSSDKLDEISSEHFMVIKANVNDLLCPVILEDCSSNGTFIKSTSSNERTIKERLKSTNGNKQQVLAANDTIFIQLNPTLAFIYRSFNTAYNELPTEINRLYHVGKELGRGAYGMVYYTLHRRTCQAYALKYITINADDQLMKPEREIELLRKLNHPCIVRMHYNYSNSNAIAIFLDFMAGGDLLDRIQQMRYLPESLTKCLFYQICCGVEYLHQQGITHRDLKPDNILLASSERETLIRISDFGLSRLQSHSNMATRCGTEIYLAPEVQTLNYTNKVDIWSLGVILYNCLCGQYPFLANSSNKLVRFQQDIWFDVSDAAKHVIRCALRVNANERPSIREMLANVWFDKNDPSIQKACQIMDKVEEFIVNSF